ncbi:hypothetical protein CDIK_3781 [Cucumispora dikerogammari]|nr:hypothetical protein CDIK_3781 [Cucumispora dikerogammari]
MGVKYGRSLVRQTPISSVTTIKSKNISICSVMFRNKVIFKRLNRNAYNTSGFLSYLQELFTFLNSEGLDNCIVIIDNVAFHKSDVIKTEFEEKGHRILFLPVYSPSLNPIEMVFSKWKNYVKRCNCVSEEQLLNEMNAGFNGISGDDCDEYYRSVQREINKALEKLPFE